MADERLRFTIEFDTRKLQADANKAREAIMGIDTQARSLTTTFNSMAKYTAAYFSVQKLQQFASSIIQVRGEFQKLETAFGVLLGSKEKADKLMQDAVKLASTTPFSLQDVASGAKQLLAYGFATDNIIDDLRRLGDVSAALGLPLERLTYLYGTTMTQGQLYSRDLLQFTTSGIPLLQSLSNQFGVTNQEMREMIEQGKIGFPEVQKAIYAMTDEGGQFNNMMGEMAKTIPGKIEKLKDSIQLMFNEIGKSQEGVINSSIEVSAYLVEHYEEIGEALLEIVAVYGVYKASLITISALQQANSIILRQAVLEKRLAAAAGIQLSNAEAIAAARTKILQIAQLGLVKSLQAVKVAMLSNPYTLTAAAVAALGYAIYKLITYQNDAEKSQQRLNDSVNEFEKEALSEERRLAQLKGELSAATKGTEEYNRIKNQIITNYGKYYSGLSQEIEEVGLLESTYKKLTVAIRESFGARQYDKFIQEEQKNLDDVIDTNLKKVQNRLLDELGDEKGTNVFENIRKAVIGGTKIKTEGRRVLSGLNKQTLESLNNMYHVGAYNFTDYRIINSISAIQDAVKLFDEADKKARSRLGIDDKNTGSGNGGGKKPDEKTITKNKAYWEKIKSDAEEDLEKLDVSEKAGEKWVEYTKTIAAAQKEIDKYSTKTSNKTPKKTDEVAEWKDLTNDIINARIEAMDEGLPKIIAKNEQAYQQEIQQLDKQKEDYLKSHKSLTQEQQQQLDDTKAAALVKLNAANNEAVKAEREAMIKENKEQKEAREKLIKDYGTYAQKRYQLIKEWEDKIAELPIEFRAEARKQGEAEIAALDDANSQIDDKFQELLEDIKKKSKKLLQEELKSAKTLYGALTSGNYDASFGFTEEQFKTLSKDTKALDNLNKKIKETENILGGKNWLGMTFGDWDNLDPSEKIRSIADAINEVGQATAQLVEALGDGDLADGISTLTDAGRQAAWSVASFQTGDIVGGITNGLGAITSAVNLLRNSLNLGGEKNNALQDKRIAEFRAVADVYDQVLDKQKALLSDTSGLDSIEAYEKAMNALSAKQKAEQQALLAYWQKGSSAGSHSYGYRLNENFDYRAIAAKTGIQIARGVGDMRGFITSLSAEDWDKFIENDLDTFVRLDSTVQDYAQNVRDAAVDTEAFGESLREALTGVSRSEITNSLAELVSNADKSFEDIEESFTGHMRSAILQTVKDKTLTDGINKWYEDFAEYNKNGLDEDEITKLRESWNDMVQAGTKEFNDATKVFGETDKDIDTREAASKGFASMSQDLGDELNGRFTAIQSHTYQIRENMQLIQRINEQSLAQLYGIRENTEHCKRLDTIDVNMRTMANALNDIQTKGLKMAL